MADKTFPIGSIIKTGEHLGIITGITFDEIDNKLVKSYVIAQYPIGYTGVDYLRQIPATEAELISEGYRSPAAEPFLNYVDQLDIASEMADAETINRYVKEAQAKVFGGD